MARPAQLNQSGKPGGGLSRRQFLGYCIALGVAGGVGGLVSCANSRRVLAPEDRAILNGLPIADAHAHPYQFFGSSRFDGSTPTVEMMSQVGMVACSFAAVGDRVKYGDVIGSPFGNTMSQLDHVKSLEKNKMIQPIVKASDIPLSVGPGDPPGAVMSIEGGDALEGDIEKLETFYDFGVRMLTVIHAHNNRIGFHQRSRQDGPLTPFGIKVIERMNELGMVVDVAHAKIQTLKGITQVTAAPIVDSHTNPMAFDYRHPGPTRLRYWPEMEMVAKTGGIVCTWPAAYGRKYRDPRTTLTHWALEILEMKKRLGIEHTGLGTDGGGGLGRKADGWQSILNIPELIKAMREAGLTQSDIAAYLGGNFLRVLNQCLG